MEMNFVPLSGGWDSAYCLVKAIQEVGAANVTAVFFDYGQEYLLPESICSRRIAEVCGVKYQAVVLDAMPCKAGVFEDRNYILIRKLVDLGASRVWFGSRCPLQCFDKFGDSNAEWALLMARKLLINIETPATMVPKWIIKRAVRKAGIHDIMIYSTEK